MASMTQPMEHERFWDLVGQSQSDAATLKQLLTHLSRDEILAFDLRLNAAMYQLDREDIHEITDGSDDGFEYVRLWIISQGRAYFESVLHDPENAPHDADDEENEEFGYAAMEAYQETFGEAMPIIRTPHSRSSGSNAAGWPDRR